MIPFISVIWVLGAFCRFLRNTVRQNYEACKCLQVSLVADSLRVHIQTFSFGLPKVLVCALAAICVW